MTNLISRRDFLKAAGGVTFLALIPTATGAFAAPAKSAASIPPLFPALPYIQPGNNSKLIPGQESLVIAWQTNNTDAQFTVSYGIDKAYKENAAISKTTVWSGDSDDGEEAYNYQASLTRLELGTRYVYRVDCNGDAIMEGFFTTRKPRGTAIKFAAFGDNSFGDISDRAIAYQTYMAYPDFVMNTGDNVYDGGLTNEYSRYFFPVYNSPEADPRVGAPLLRSVPFYTVIANHDVHRKGPDKGPVADFDKDPDSLAYFTSMSLPLNGPSSLTIPTPAVGAADAVARFKLAAGSRYPQMANYSYDYGDAHFLCLDSNVYIDPTDPALQSWIESDLQGTDAMWSFVVYHHPAFNVGAEHYTEQHMRVLSPIFETHGVDFILHGHEHTYQRTMPIKFAPGDSSKAKNLGSKDRLIPGIFTIDPQFDGVAQTKPNGIIYVTTGAGGKHLYDADHNQNPSTWLHPEDKSVSYVAKFVSDRHSLTVFEIDGKSLRMRQIDQFGNEIDKITVTKA